MTILCLLLVSAALLSTSVSSANAARTVRSWAGWHDSSGADPIATIEDLQVSRDAISPRGGAVLFAFHSTASQHVRITAANQFGHVVRTIADADIGIGDQSYSWDGKDDTGALVPDGAYEVVVEADDGHDSMSVADEIRIDHVAPKLTVTTTPIRVRAGARSVRVPIRLSETAMLDAVASGSVVRGSTTSERAAGRQSLVFPLLRTFRGSGTLRVRLAVTDAAGHRATGTAAIQVSIASDHGGSTAPAPAIPITGSSTITWPLSGALTSRFGTRWGRKHEGIDIGVPTGRHIGAAAPGTVTYAGWMSGYGNATIISHGRLSTLYGHQSKIKVHVGQRVTRGQLIGLVGSTGHSTGPHLHFEVRVNGVAKNPLSYLA
jgi:murein DD-endopeptidase MepM/ murein hydrolase activator NlpD